MEALPGGGGSAAHPDPNPLQRHPATAFRLAVSTARLRVYRTPPSLLGPNDPHTHGAPHRTTASTSIESDVAPLDTSTHGQFKGVHVSRIGCGLPRRRLGHDSSRIGFFAARAWKCRLLPTEYAPWKNRGLGKGRLSMADAACQRRLVLGRRGPARAAGTRLLPSSLCRPLGRFSHQSQGCSVTRTQSLGGRDPVVASSTRAMMGVRF